MQQGKPRIDLKLGGANIFIAPVATGDGVNAAPTTPYQGLDHFGLSVSGIDAIAADLKAKGVEFTREPTTVRPGVRVCFIRGPKACRSNCSIATSSDFVGWVERSETHQAAANKKSDGFRFALPVLRIMSGRIPNADALLRSRRLLDGLAYRARGERREVRAEAVDLAKGEQRSDDYLKINPQGRVPVLQLDNGEPSPRTPRSCPISASASRLWPTDRRPRPRRCR